MRRREEIYEEAADLLLILAALQVGGVASKSPGRISPAASACRSNRGRDTAAPDG